MNNTNTGLLGRPRRTLLVLMVLVAGLLAPGLVLQPAQAVTYYSSVTFDKNPTNPLNSTLTLRVWYNQPGPITAYQKTWRAGSGNGSTNACTKRAGWLPNGSYSMTMLDNKTGTVRGDVLQLPDKNCGNGTYRTELFIHSETNTDGTQCAARSGEDRDCRWEGDADFSSWGCIKLRPADLATLFSTLRKYHGTQNGGRSPATLYVVS